VVPVSLTTMQGIERNGIYQLFLGKKLRSTLVDWDTHARHCVAKLREMYASKVDDPWFNELIQLMRTRSAEFERLWNDHEIALSHEGIKHYEHPEVGRLVFDFTVLDVVDERMASLRLVTYVPAPGTGTREKMEALLSKPIPLPVPEAETAPQHQVPT
jgi:transcription regulator MmyB-like protein